MKSVYSMLAQSAKKNPGVCPVRRIVVLKRKSDYRKCLAVLSKAGIRPVKKSVALRMICCHAKRSGKWRELRNHPGIAYVEQDKKARAHGADSRAAKRSRSAMKGKWTAVARSEKCPPKAPWNVCRVQSPPIWPRTRGAGVKVGVLDTGIARHPDLRIAGGVNTITGGSFADDNGHGTHVAGIIAATGKGKLLGNAPAARLYAVKVLDRDGAGFISDIVEGIDWCLKRGIKVMNMSFGLSGESRLLRSAIRRARRQGAVISASAGNSGPNNISIDAPARYPETIAVAASTFDNRIASFSSRGKGIDVAAPGVDIDSTWLNGGYKRMSGTSMSSPHVAGCAALLRGLSPSIGAGEVARRFRATARRIPGGVRAAGAGLLQAEPAAKGLGVRRRRER